jgi:phosphinothricin acetyltransferase
MEQTMLFDKQGSLTMPDEKPNSDKSPHIRDASVADAERICEIYSHYVLNTTVTFEIEPPAPEEMVRRIERVLEKHTWLVAEDGGIVRGYAYGSTFKERAAYAHSTEVTVYLDKDSCGMGIGSMLFGRLLDRLQSLGTVHAIGGIALPNQASVKLHESFGFRQVAHFHQIGFKLGQWIDVGYWQKQLNPLPSGGKTPNRENRP